MSGLKGKEVVGSDIAQELRFVKFINGKSTTKIIQRIQNAKANN